MNKTRMIVRVAMCVAILIAGQMVLSAVSGVEIVTVLMLCFAFAYGIRTGVAIATVFSLVRCFYFGFHVDIIVLYLIYFNLFGVFFGWLGKRFAGEISLLRMVIIVASAMGFTICFTLLDDTIKIVMFGFHVKAAWVYILQSLPAMITQTICTLVTVSVLFVPLTRMIRRIDSQ